MGVRGGGKKGACEDGALGSASLLTCFLVSLVSVGRLALLARRRLWVVAPAFCSLLRSEWKSPTRLVHPTLYLSESGTREVRAVGGCMGSRQSERSQAIWQNLSLFALILNPSLDTSWVTGQNSPLTFYYRDYLCGQTTVHCPAGEKPGRSLQRCRFPPAPPEGMRAEDSLTPVGLQSTCGWGPKDFFSSGG